MSLLVAYGVSPTALLPWSICHVRDAGFRFLAVATLAIVLSGAATDAVAGQPAPGRLARLSEAPPAEGAATTPLRCPYGFDSDMPAATFCVYRGDAFGSNGEVCATDVVVIWNSLVAASPSRGAPDGLAAAADREVYVGFVADPQLVVRAIVDPARGDRAELVGYTFGDAAASQALAGVMTLRAVRSGAADVLSLTLPQPQRFHPGSCTFASYAGTFLGMIRAPGEASETDALLAPRK